MSIMGIYGSYWFKTVNWIALFELIFRSFPKSEFSNRPLTDCVKKIKISKGVALVSLLQILPQSYISTVACRKTGLFDKLLCK